MANAVGRVYVQYAVRAYFEYDGCNDFCLSPLYQTQSELMKNWRSGRKVRCVCGKLPIDVTLHNDYGGGRYWPGKACLACMAIVDGFEEPTDSTGEYLGQDGEPYVDAEYTVIKDEKNLES